MTDLEKTIKNLEKIYNELPSLAYKIPFIKEEFDMSKYGCYYGGSVRVIICRTYGCGLGNSVRLFDISKKEYYNNDGRFDYRLFTDSMLPSLITYLRARSRLWYYLFSAEWGHKSSKFKTFDHFIERVGNVIKLLKEKGVCNVDFNPQKSNDLVIIE